MRYIVEENDNFDWSKINTGDVVYLSGNFDVLEINDAGKSTNQPESDFSLISVVQDSTVEIGQLILNRCNQIVFGGENEEETSRIHIHSLKVYSDEDYANKRAKPNLVELNDCNYTEISMCDIYSDDSDEGDWSEWSVGEWRRYSQNGVLVNGGVGCRVLSNYIEAVNYGITLISEWSSASGNAIYGFCGDGIRLLKNNTIASSNYIAYSYNECIVGTDDCLHSSDQEGNHNDAIQIWMQNDQNKQDVTLPITGLSVTYNTIYCPSTTTQETFDNSTHGIGAFNGMVIDSDFIGNEILTNHYHGLTITYAKDCFVDNNLVIPEDLEHISQININPSEAGSGNTVSNNHVIKTSYPIYIDKIQQNNLDFILPNNVENPIPNSNKYLNSASMVEKKNLIKSKITGV